jgi:hypothetical protein
MAMGDHDDKKKRDQEDSYELGPVDNVHDLEPETGVGPGRKAKAQDRIVNPTSSGYFEIEGGADGGLGAPLHLGAELKKDGGTKISEYEAAYNTYAAPLRSTLRAMGRVKDVSLTGAPMTREELLSRPELAARFRRLSADKGDVQQDQAFDTWSTQQTKMKLDIQRYGAGQHELAGIIANYRRVQVRLKEKRTEQERSDKLKEVKEIDEAAETLAKIVDVSVEAWGAVGEIDEMLESHAALDEYAEGAGSAAGLPQSGNPDWEHSTINDPSGTGASTRSAAQRMTGGGRQKHIGGKSAGGVVLEAKEQLEKTGKFELSLEGIFKAVIGGEHYVQLQKELEDLSKKMKKLEMEQEEQDIRSANEQLTGFKMEFAARKQDVRADRVAARKGARTFAKSMGAGKEGIATMYAAEAYQELAAFGELALEQRRAFVDPLWRPVHDYLYGYDAHRFAAIGAMDDASALAMNLRAVQEQNVYFRQQLPHWQKVAKDWSDFLGDRTGAGLISDANEADEKSKAP